MIKFVAGRFYIYQGGRFGEKEEKFLLLRIEASTYYENRKFIFLMNGFERFYFKPRNYFKEMPLPKSKLKTTYWK